MKPTARTSSHSVRASDELWLRARKRADAEGVSLNFVLNEILEGYARGMVNLPKKQVIRQFVK